MRFQGWMHKILMQKNVTLYFPLYVNLYYAVRRFYCVHNKFVQSLFLYINKSCIFREQFLLLAQMTTYLKDLTQSIGRYGGLSWQNWFKGVWKHK